ncbi:MAG: hypothetical protein WKF96_17630 [Solirubrobacteraceae bacterium]
MLALDTEFPNSVTLNASKAADRGGAVWRRHLEGRVDEQGQWRAWPQPHDMTRRFESWDDAHVEFGRELKRLRMRGEPYVQRPVPTPRRLLAALSGYSFDALRERNRGTRVEPGQVTSAVPMSRKEPDLMPPAPARGGLAVVGDHKTGRSTLLAHVVEQDLACRRLAVIVLQLPGKPSIAHGLPLSAVIDLHGVVAVGLGAVVESDDPDVRAWPSAATADASLETGRDVSLVVDDAEDVMDTLARILRHEDTPQLHVSAAWSPRLAPEHLALWLMLRTRVMFRIADKNVVRPFHSTWDTVLRAGALAGSSTSPRGL